MLRLQDTGVKNMFKRLGLLFFLVVFALCEAKPPQLTPHDTRIKVEEILKAHVSYQKLTTELVRRALQNYLEEIDPLKTYFIADEVDKWVNPSDELLNKTLEGYKKEDFKTFIEIHEKMVSAIKRRDVIEKNMEKAELPKGVKPSEFKDAPWVANEAELQDRLLRIKSLQLEAAKKLDPETMQQFLQRLNKRRANREEELTAHSSQERQQLVLSYVLKATSSALDSQTAYFTPSEANQFMMQVQQRLFGIGAQLRDDLNGFTITRLIEGGPAMMSNKLKLGDRIIAVDHEPVMGMDITEAVELIRGPQGTAVTLTILRANSGDENKQEEKLDIEIIRAEVVLKETRLETNFEPYGDGVIAILHLFSFYQDNNSSSAGDLREALEKLKKEHHLKGVVLDLRNDAGGFLPQAVAVTGLFITKGIVVSVKDNSGAVQHLRNTEENITWDGPLMVLTNRGSASAAEIVAQTLQDYGRAIVVGDAETFGKGTFQTFTLESVNYGKVNPKGEYKVTRGRYYTVSGKSPQLTGVKADIIVPSLLAELDVGEKYSKFPLENEVISPNFEDDLSDIPLVHRAQINRLYKFNLQTVLDAYNPYIDQLRANSKRRIENNKNYQNFLKEIAKKDFVSEHIEIFGQADLQLNEAMSIMKDLIFLLDQKTLSEIPAA